MDTDESSENFNWTENFIRNTSRLLEERGLLDGDLAKSVDVSATTVSAWLNGHAKPIFINVWKVADALDESIDDLVGRKRPGSALLERYRAELLARAEALKQVLPSEPDDAAGPAATEEPKPARKSSGKKAEKGKKPKEPKTSKKAKKKNPPKS